MSNNELKRDLSVLLLLIFALLIYVGAYYTLLDEPENVVVSLIGYGPWDRVPHYKIGGRFSETLFSPIHALDREIRPDRWVIPAWPRNPEEERKQIKQTLKKVNQEST